MKRAFQIAALATCGALLWWLFRHEEPAPTAPSAAAASPPASALEPGAIASGAGAPSGAGAERPASPRENLAAASLSLNDTPLPEQEYFQQLQALNHSDKRAALTLVEKGEQWYPSVGQLAEARRALRVTLLVDLGEMAEARRFTREFIAQYPHSPYRRLVQGVTGIHPRPSGPRPSAEAP